MIKLKNKILCFLFLLSTANCFSQKIKYDLDANGKEDFVTFDEENFNVIVNLNGFNEAFEIPEILSYENISIREFDAKTINIHYAASVSTIDLLIKYENKKWVLKNSIFYAPCQTCQDGEIKTCENVIDLPIDKVTDENITALVFKEYNCRKFYENIKGLSVKELCQYTDKILMKEIILDVETIQKTLKMYPVTKKNIKAYKKIKKALDKINFDTSLLEKKIQQFEKQKQ